MGYTKHNDTMLAFIATIAAAFNYREMTPESYTTDATMANSLTQEIVRLTRGQMAVIAYIDAIYPAPLQDDIDLTFVFVHAPKKGQAAPGGPYHAVINTAWHKFAIERAVQYAIARYVDRMSGTQFDDIKWDEITIKCGPCGKSWFDEDDDECAAAEKAEVFAVLMAASETLGIANPFAAPGFMAQAVLMDARLIEFNDHFHEAMINAHILRLAEM